MLKKNLEIINKEAASDQGMDVVIVSTSTKAQAKAWQTRLDLARGSIIKKTALIACVDEDWEGGAGNGLGTLYAYQKAAKQLLKRSGVNLVEEQRQGASIAIYHTAGLGTRLSPLTASEEGNKPRIKLPWIYQANSQPVFSSILENVIKQTALFAPCRKSRLSVFWGDQIFIPEKLCDQPPSHHVEILGIFHPDPSEKEWKERHLESYGLLAIDAAGLSHHLDKCPWPLFQELLAQKKIDISGGLGTSLGTFSLSFEMTQALLSEFSKELSAKNSKMDSDPCFWMALSLDLEPFVSAMVNKHWTPSEASAHYLRMAEFKKIFSAKHGNALFHAADLGENSLWWDYGTLQSYFQNNLKLCEESLEGACMRSFYSQNLSIPSKPGDPLAQDAHSCLCKCNIRSGTIKNSVLVGVTADHLEVENCLLINCRLSSFRGKGNLLYNVSEKDSFATAENEVRADLLMRKDKTCLKLRTSLLRDGKNDWELCLEGNLFSYADLHKLLQKQP